MFPILETAGFPPERLREILDKYRPAFRLKVYHRSVYPEKEGEKVEGILSRYTYSKDISIELCLVIHNLFLDYSFFLPFLEIESVTGFYIEILPEALGEEKLRRTEKVREVIAPLLGLIKHASQRKLRITIGCVLPPCGFSDGDFGFLAKVGALPKRCLPYPGVLPDLRVYHCRALIQEAERRLFSFKDLAGVKEHFFLRYGESQVKNYLFAECKQCVSYKLKVCLGGCLALKK